MRRHQVLTGAVNQGNHCFSVGSVASFTFWAYGSGCDLIILGVDLQPIHIIPGHVKGYKLITCLDCCQFCGKIAVSYGCEIVIYSPKLIKNENDGVPVFTWMEEATLSLKEKFGIATVLSWASTGHRLLVGCKEILLWEVQKEIPQKEPKRQTLKVQFSIEEIVEENEDEYGFSDDSKEKEVKWDLAWHSDIVENPCEIQFSPDDALFASISRGDSMIKVWHQRTALPMHLFQDTTRKQNGGESYQNAMSSSSHMNHFDVRQSSPTLSTKLDFTFTYLIHPKPVAGFSWRKGIPLLPNGTMPNILISSCTDNMCRIWCETLTPDTDITKLASTHATVQPKHPVGKKRGMPQSEKNASAIPVKKSVSAPMIEHDFGNERITEITRKPIKRMFRHFHIAATINPTSDVPLLPNISSMDSCVDGAVDDGHNSGPLVFTVHWLDNKHHHAMAHLNKILHEAMSDEKNEDLISEKQNEMEDDRTSVSSSSTVPSIRSSSRPSSPLKRPSGFTGKFPVWDIKRPESIDAFLSCLASPVSPEVQSDLGLSLPSNVYDTLRRSWIDQSDALFAIHPADGSLLVWHVNFLDENRCGQIRQAQVSFSSRIPMAIPARDASTLCSRMVLYANHYSAHLAFNNVASTPSANPQKSQDTGVPEPSDQEFIATDGHASPSISLLSKHSDGSLNQWEIVFSSTAYYSTVSSITHRLRFCGHRYHLSDIFCHPTLPLLLTTSHHHDRSQKKNSFEKSIDKQSSSVKSELIMWRVDPVGALCHSGGVTELARLSGPLVDDFSKVAWFPVLFPSWCLGASNSSPSTCLLSLHKNSFRIYQAVIDAEELLDELEIPGDICMREGQVGCVASQQSSSHPGCILLLDTINLGREVNIPGNEILLLSVFPEGQFFDEAKSDNDTSDEKTQKKHGVMESFFVVLVLKSRVNITVKTWKITFTANLYSVAGARTRRSTTAAISESDSSEDYGDDDNKTEDISETGTRKISYLNVTSIELQSQVLNHPVREDIKIVSAVSDPFSLSVFHHIQVLPFTILTTSESGRIFFWRGTRKVSEVADNETVQWLPWNASCSGKKPSDIALPQIDIGGAPLVVKMAHCCMLACLSTTDVIGGTKCYASIFECVSSGGAVWHLQDRILVGAVDFDSIKRVHIDWLSCEDGTFLLTINLGRKVKIYTQSPIGMQWEDTANSRLPAKDVKRRDSGGPSIRPLLKRQSTLDAVTRHKLLGNYKSGKSFDAGSTDSNHLPHWSLLSEIALGNSTGLSATHFDKSAAFDPQPVMVAWVRDGLLLVGTEAEMHVFCHWVEQDDSSKSAPPNSGILYGSASLSQSMADGLCQYLMHESQDGGQLSHNSPVVSLMSVADVLSPCLPQYHPLVLSELTNGGHLDHVKHILINLAGAINVQFEPKDGVIQVEPVSLKKFGLEVSNDGKESDQKSRNLAPVLLYDLLDENGRINEKSFAPTHEKNLNATPGATMSTKTQNLKQQQEKSGYHDLFADDLMDEEEDKLELIFDEEPRPASDDLIDLTQFEPGYLGPEHCQVLHNYLSRNLLPGLSSLDQMELMAIADTVANAVDTKVSSDTVGIGVDGGGRGYATSGNTATESMDQCGMRFVFAMHNHLCLLRSLPATQRAKLLRQGLESCHFAWAFHSDAEEEMLSLISSVQRGAPEWDELRSFGAGWWIRSTPTLRRLVEQTARAAFQKNNNPLDAAIFYMALNKKNVLKGLFKSVHEDRMMNFFSQDFTEERWHRAALKNAFALMGKQRFQEAAAFFLLANSVQDAVEVCIDKIADLQLASIIVRLYNQEKSPTAHAEFLREYVLGEKQDTDKIGKERMILPDPFIRSMAYWQLGSYDESLKTLLDNKTNSNDDSHVNITDVFNFYNFLRQHPLIMRQKKIDQSQAVSTTDQQIDERITQEERMLFFATASSHLDAGCPLLTLDVLSSLPPSRDDEYNVAEKGKTDITVNDPSRNSSLNVAMSTDWGEPTTMETSFDAGIKDELELDWSESDEEESESERTEDRPRINVIAPTPLKKEKEEIKTEPEKTEVKKGKALYSDMYAHQLRLMACLRIFVSELKSLAMTYHADSGQIREQLYTWLEKETEVLHRISPQPHVRCPSARFSELNQSGVNDTDKSQKSEFSSGSESDGGPKMIFKGTESPVAGSNSLQPVPSLHELYMAEKQDWKMRRETAGHRRRWLRQYRRFLRTLLSYCGLHDDAQGSLAPLRMELLLLLQDSLQERTPQQLSSPVPNPTSVPLLSSSTVACQTVVAEPTVRLAHMAQDILATLLTFSDPPPYANWNGTQLPTVLLCRQAEALSYCLYQSLCDTNSKTYRARLLDNDRSNTPETLLMSTSVASGTGSEHRYVPPSTQPSQWPGVVSLQALLNSESGDNRPKLIVLLCESLVAIYISLLIHGLQACNSLLLYRLVSNPLNEKTWNAVFGGGARVVVKYSRPTTDVAGNTSSQMSGSPGSKVRDKLNRKVLSYSIERNASFTSSHSADTGSYKEKFVAPEITLWDYLLSKPLVTFFGAEEVSFESDSDMDTDSNCNNTFSDSDSLDEFGEPKQNAKVTEHGDPNSYSWHIMRLAIARSVLQNFKNFLPTTGLELSELGTSSPLLNSTLQMLTQWQISLVKELESFSEMPKDYIKGIQGVGTALRGRPAILKHQAMLDPNNTPFSGSSMEALGARRLWHCLVRRENLQELFIHYIFQKKTANTIISQPPPLTKKMGTRRATIAVMSPDADSGNQQFHYEDLKSGMGAADGRIGKVKILHKENEIISSFCINNANPNCVVLATSRDFQEIDVSAVLASDTCSWVEEDIPTNLLQEETQKTTQKDEDFLVVSRRQSMFVSPNPQIQHQSSSSSSQGQWTGSAQTGQGATVLLKRSFSGVRRMTSHPTLPYYLTGHHDGSIRMWEWGHQQQISQFRTTGQFPKVTNLHFSLLGNKIAAVDADGFLALWQVSSPKKPYMYHQCHDRSAADCCFMSSTSTVATVGLSANNRNVAIWDTLLPPRSMLVKDFVVHESVGATCVSYAAQRRTLVVGGRDGKVSIFDLRRHDDPLHCYTAHEAPIKCIGLSPDEKMFVTGSIVGDVRLWDLNSHLLAYNLSGEHARTSIFRNYGSGTMKVQIDSPGNKVFSCGADGTLKIRVLPHDLERDYGLGNSIGSRIHKLTLQKQVVKLANAIRQQCLAY